MLLKKKVQADLSRFPCCVFHVFNFWYLSENTKQWQIQIQNHEDKSQSCRAINQADVPHLEQLTWIWHPVLLWWISLRFWEILFLRKLRYPQSFSPLVLFFVFVFVFYFIHYSHETCEECAWGRMGERFVRNVIKSQLILIPSSSYPQHSHTHNRW